MTQKEKASVMLSGLASMLRSMSSPIEKPEDIFEFIAESLDQIDEMIMTDTTP